MSSMQSEIGPIARPQRGGALDRGWLWFGLGLAIVMVGLLVGPRVPDSEQAQRCVQNVRLAGPFGTHVNCDSPEFLRLAREPGALLEPTNFRQDRPGLVMAAALLSWPLAPLGHLVDALGMTSSRTDSDQQQLRNAMLKALPAFAAYLILNVLFLVLSFYLLRKICEPWLTDSASSLAILASVGSLIFANDVVKAFFYSPHTQMLNVLTPLFAVYASWRALNGDLRSTRFAATIGAIIGIGFITYQVFALVPLCMLLCAGIFLLRFGTREDWIRSGANTLVLIVLSALPAVLWPLYVISRIGTFHSAAFSEGQVYWMVDVLRQGGPFALAQEWFGKLATLFKLALPQALPILAFVAAGLAVAAMHGRRAGSRLAAAVPLVLVCLLVSAAMAGFYTSAGPIYPRLAYPALPALIAAVAVSVLAIHSVLGQPQRRLMAYGFALIAICQTAFVIIKDGPYHGP